jgi:hypothetical protein
LVSSAVHWVSQSIILQGEENPDNPMLAGMREYVASQKGHRP